MNSLLNLKTTNRLFRSPPSRSYLWCGLFLIALLVACFGLAPTAQALLPAPPPDGGYPNFNTAEGQGALFSLTTGTGNSAIGAFSLFSNTDGSTNTAVGAAALALNTDGMNNTALGPGALFFNSTGGFNTATGWETLANNTTAFNNVGTGFQALFSTTSGGANTGCGSQALTSNTTGGGNTAMGAQALFSNNGSRNIAVGAQAGADLTSGSDNIDIGNRGIVGESSTTRIGTVQTKTFIAGIAGVDVHSFDVVAIDNATGQLGELDLCDAVNNHCLAAVAASGSAKTSRRLDRQIASYKKDNAKLRQKVEKLETAIAQQRKDSQLTAANQQKEIRALTAALKEQASQIQKVSAQIELSKTAPQTVVNNQ